MTGSIDYSAVLADLEARRATLDAAIAGIRAMLNGATPELEDHPAEEGASGATPPRARAATAAQLASDTFFGLSTHEAIRKFLGMAKRPQSAVAIARALTEGGQVNATDEKAAYVNVASSLRRRPGFVKTRNKEWGLAEWYQQKKADTE